MVSEVLVPRPALSCTENDMSFVDVQRCDDARLLDSWPWETVDQESDPFILYRWRQRLQCALIETISPGQAANATLAVDADLLKTRQRWVETVIDKVIDGRTRHNILYLEIFHAVLKQFRKANLHLQHIGYTLFSAWIEHSQTSAWISTRGCTCDNLELAASLVCLNDLAKICSIAFERDVLVQKAAAARGLLLNHLQHFCDLWCYPYISVARRSLELVSRLIRNPIDDTMMEGVLRALLAWTDRLQPHFTIDKFWGCFEMDRTEFYYRPLIQNDNVIVDRECLKLAMQVLVASLCSLADYNEVDASMTAIFEQILHRIIAWRQSMSDQQLLEAVLELHGSNDEDAVNLQLDVLTIDRKLRRADEGSSFKQCFQELIEVVSPNRLFLWFCARTGMDYSLLVDLLLSNETEFLHFLVQYLKHIEMDPDAFIRTCSELVDDDGGIDTVIDMLSRLAGVLKAGGFPYNPRHLINRLNNILELIHTHCR